MTINKAFNLQEQIFDRLRAIEIEQFKTPDQPDRPILDRIDQPGKGADVHGRGRASTKKFVQPGPKPGEVIFP